jgi:hypothetical protein
MYNRLYTNTSNVKAIAGLLLTTVLVTYCATNSEKIVDGAISLAKTGVRKANEFLHNGKKQYAVLVRENGKLVDSGVRVWR